MPYVTVKDQHGNVLVNNTPVDFVDGKKELLKHHGFFFDREKNDFVHPEGYTYGYSLLLPEHWNNVGRMGAHLEPGR